MTTQSKPARGWIAIFYILVFLVSFLLRVWHPISRPLQWVKRSENFYDAILDEQDWAKTYQMSHPGVTTMIISGLSSRAYDKALNSSSFVWNGYESFVEWAAPREASFFGKQVVAANIGLAFSLAILIVATTFSLQRLGGWHLAITSSIFLTFSPIMLTHGRVVHLDALISALMLLSALLLMLHIRDGTYQWLILSGLTGGLAILNKPVSFFMIPYLGLAMATPIAIAIDKNRKSNLRIQPAWLISQIGKKLLFPAVIWLGLAASTYVIWPSMWVQPMWSIRQIVDYTLFQAETVHPNPIFFLGNALTSDPPGVLFYPISLFFNSSFITLPLAVIALLVYSIWSERITLPIAREYFWLLVAFVVFFIMQMTLGDKMLQRYILPAHAAFEVVAAVGLVALIDLAKRTLQSSGRSLSRAVLPVSMGIVLGAHLLLVITFFPDIGAHKNHLLGGNKVAINVLELGGQNEGILPAMAYLQSLPNTSKLDIGMSFFSMTSTPQYVDSNRVLMMRGTDLKPVDYLFFTTELFQRYEFTPEQVAATPQVTVLFDGVPYMILYASLKEPTTPIVIHRGGTWLVGLAWIWTLALVGITSWSLRKQQLTSST